MTTEKKIQAYKDGYALGKAKERERITQELKGFIYPVFLNEKIALEVLKKVTEYLHGKN